MNDLAEKTMDISQFLVDKTGVVTAAPPPWRGKAAPDLSRSVSFEKIPWDSGPAQNASSRQFPVTFSRK